MSHARPRSLSTVALLADIPSTGHLGDTQAKRFNVRETGLAEQATEFLDFAQWRLSEGHKVVALYPAWHADRAERVIRFARGSLGTDHIAGVGVNISPLALSLVADQLAYLAPYLPAGLVGALPKELSAHMLAGAWLHSVSNLSHIPISVKQHLGSFAPRTTFLAFSTPVQRVGRVKKNNPAPNIPSRPIEPVQLLVAAPSGTDTSDFEAQFTATMRPVAARSLPEQPLGGAYWGTAKYIEFVALSAHPQALTSVVNAVRPTTCSWCHELTNDARCPFCGSANQPAAGRPPAYSRASDVPAPSVTDSGTAAAADPSHERRGVSDSGAGQGPAARDGIPPSRPGSGPHSTTSLLDGAPSHSPAPASPSASRFDGTEPSRFTV